MTAPTPRAVYAAVVGTALAVAPVALSPALWPLWAALWGVGVLLLAVDWGLAVRPRELEVTVDLAPSVAVGATAEATLTVRGTRPVFRAELRVDVSDDVDPPEQLTVHGRDGSATVTMSLTARRRGKAVLEALWIRTHGPMGLISHVQRRPLDRSVAVLTNVRQVRLEALRFTLGDPTLRTGLKVERYPGDGTEFDSLKEFQRGHDRRAIDWKASARHNRLLVREFRAERNHQVVVALDTGHLMAEPLDGLARLDHAIHAALSVAWIGVRTGDRVGMFAFGARPGSFVSPRAGVAGFQGLLAAASDLSYSAEETNFTLGLTHLATRLRRRSLVIVFTDFVDSVMAELMVDNLDRLARRHLVLFVALDDPGVSDILDAEPTDLDAMNRAVVADNLRREREVVMRRLQRSGVLCVDATPSAVGGELLNRYLTVKRREQI